MLAKIILASAFVALAAAQSAVLTFTKVPNPITDGQPQALTYSTNDTSTPVTIILRKGPSTNLQTVSTLTTSATGGQYIWTPPTSLADGTDYALQIVQGSQYNYFGPFQVQGAVASQVSSAASSSAAAASASPYVSSTVSANGTAATTIPVAPVTPVGTVSAATGTALPRNTTMSMATLTAASGSASITPSGSSTSMADATASSSGAGFQSTASASSTAAATNGAAGVQAGGALALVFGAGAAVFYLL
ncbi:hypothetical protein LTR53_004060 [Teratosphaeriaceae sp. CCFEE 6253]|nr:hypothetical protein LTR53_004060 [Teratosphaeriaceae sp. CCFEE 6253]